MEDDGPGHAGVTGSERFLFWHCRKSYLRFWSYANLFSDQGINDRGEGRELCDVTVVFGNTVILFSDKNCHFPNSGDLGLDWTRWRRRAIENSRKQLIGAERWIKKFPNRVFLDAGCTRPFPLDLSAPDLKIFKICIALGASERCSAHFQGSSGSLFQTARESMVDLSAPANAFVVSNLDEKGNLCHVFDEVTLPVLLKELDTIVDLVEYLTLKEKLINDGTIGAIPSEEDLIGLFLGTRAGILEIQNYDVDTIIIAEGIYGDVISRPEYQKYVEANKISYFWDQIIRYQLDCTVEGRLLPGSVMTISGNEEILRALAAESRLSRRLLSTTFLELYAMKSRAEIHSRTVLGQSDTLFVFRIHPWDGQDFGKYRETRKEALLAYMILAASRQMDARQVVGICVEGVAPGADGYEIAAMTFDSWNDEMRAMAQVLQEEFEQERTSNRTFKRIRLPHQRPWAVKSIKDTRSGPSRDDRRKRRRAERKRRK